MVELSDVGVIGLAVMGQNLALNFATNGYRTSLYNRTIERTQELLDREPGLPLKGFKTIKEFVESLVQPRRIILMVKAGDAVDQMLEMLLPYLEQGDTVADGGNSYYGDWQSRQERLASKGIHFVSCGISGGEEGARHGASIMPSGSDAAKEAWTPLMTSIAARDWLGNRCCTWVGPQGSGHFVKMVHNGIEYGLMQLIGEIYDLLSRGYHRSIDQSAETFESWKSGVLEAYLIDITADILHYRDDKGEAIVDKIVDAAAQKGTGRWSVEEALKLGVPLTIIAEAVQARSLSSNQPLRQTMRGGRQGVALEGDVFSKVVEDRLQDALYAAQILTYAQGFHLIESMSQIHGWGLSFAELARIWSGGCIIRSKLLQEIHHSYTHGGQGLLSSQWAKQLDILTAGLRQTVARGVELAIPLPALSAALAYYDSLTSDRLPAYLLQAQRDYFGAHTYQRIDAPLDQHFHTDWSHRGGPVTSTPYQA